MFGTIVISRPGSRSRSRAANASLIATIASASRTHAASVRAIRARTRGGIAVTAFDSAARSITS
jgi:hypothetical protein